MQMPLYSKLKPTLDPKCGSPACFDMPSKKRKCKDCDRLPEGWKMPGYVAKQYF